MEKIGTGILFIEAGFGNPTLTKNHTAIAVNSKIEKWVLWFSSTNNRYVIPAT